MDILFLPFFVLIDYSAIAQLPFYSESTLLYRLASYNAILFWQKGGNIMAIKSANVTAREEPEIKDKVAIRLQRVRNVTRKIGLSFGISALPISFCDIRYRSAIKCEYFLQKASIEE